MKEQEASVEALSFTICLEEALGFDDMSSSDFQTEIARVGIIEKDSQCHQRSMMYILCD